MKNVGIVVLIALVIGNLFFYRAWQNKKEEVKEMKVSESALFAQLDSVANIPNDTILSEPIVIHDTITIHKTKWLKTAPKTAKVYSDSIINDSINVRVNVIADSVYGFKWEYTPLYKILEKKIYISKPVPVIKYVDRKVPQSGLFFIGGIGIDEAYSEFSGKIGLQYLSKKKSIFGFDLVRVGKSNIYMANYGVKL